MDYCNVPMSFVIDQYKFSDNDDDTDDRPIHNCSN